jgi:hypothetical protein
MDGVWLSGAKHKSKPFSRAFRSLHKILLADLGEILVHSKVRFRMVCVILVFRIPALGNFSIVRVLYFSTSKTFQ